MENNDKSIVVTLELEVTDGALSGRVSDGNGAQREFAGWLGMVGAIDALLPPTAAPWDKACPEAQQPQSPETPSDPPQERDQ